MGDEAFPIELQAVDTVLAVRRGAFDIAEVGIVVAPELGVPCLVQRFDGTVLAFQPAAEGLLTQLAVALAADAVVTDTEFGADILISAQLPMGKEEGLDKALQELSAGSLALLTEEPIFTAGPREEI